MLSNSPLLNGWLIDNGIGLRDEAGQLYAISVPVSSYRFEEKKQTLIDALEHTIEALKRIFGSGRGT